MITMDKVLIEFLYLLIPIMIGLYHHPVQARPDGPPLRTVDVTYIENATPKWEPKSRFGNRPIYYAKHHYYRVMKTCRGYHKRGIASWYGTRFHNHKTSNGEKYNMYAMTAAHKSLPLPTYVRVRNLENGREIVVRVNDRGPFHANRIIDLSYVAAKKLGMLKKGTANVEVTAIDTQRDADTSNDDNYIEMTEDMTEEPLEDQRIFLQVGAFNNRENADYQATQVSQVTDSPVQTDIITTNHGNFYRVQVGPLTSIQMSERVQAKLEAAGLGNAIPLVQ